jgi:hypothetical protein
MGDTRAASGPAHGIMAHKQYTSIPEKKTVSILSSSLYKGVYPPTKKYLINIRWNFSIEFIIHYLCNNDTG